jgi:hypothetical protein
LLVKSSFTVIPFPFPVTDEVNGGLGNPLMLTNVHDGDAGCCCKLIFPAAVMMAAGGSKVNVLGVVNETFTVWSGMGWSPWG